MRRSVVPIYALFLLVRGRRSADRAIAGLSILLFAVLTVGVIALVASIWQAHGLLIALVAGLALGAVGDVMVGFFLGLAASVGVIELFRARRRLR